VPKFL